jgi:hypothetical protein
VSAYTCPVCGYQALTEHPQPPEGGGSLEICPSCGYQFGVSDVDRGITYSQWRDSWIAAECVGGLPAMHRQDGIRGGG